MRLRQAQARQQQARLAARHRGRLLSRSHRPAQAGTRPNPVRGRWQRDADHRHARLRPGPRHAFAQVLASELGVPFDKMRLEQNDSDLVHTGAGTGGSRSITASGTAIVEASRLVIAKGKIAAAHLLETSEADIEFEGGRFTVAGTDRGIGLSTWRSGCAKASCRRACRFARRRSHHPGDPLDLPERLPCRRGRDRSRHRRHPRGALHRGQRFRHHRQSDDRRRPVARRRGARHRPGTDGAGLLRRERPADHRLVHGLCDAARRGRADDRDRRSPDRRASPIRSASRAAARPAAPAASSASSTPCSTRCRIRHHRILDMPLTAEKVWRAIRDAKAQDGVSLTPRGSSAPPPTAAGRGRCRR